LCNLGCCRRKCRSHSTRLSHGKLNCQIRPVFLYSHLKNLLEKHWWLCYSSILFWLVLRQILSLTLYFPRAKTVLISCPRHHILRYNLQCLPLFKVELIGVY
jgi:hypothetical protein